MQLRRCFEVVRSACCNVLMFFSAPAASVLILQYSQRVVAIIGGLLATSGMVLASLDLSLPWLYLSMGVLQGSAFGTLGCQLKSEE